MRIKPEQKRRLIVLCTHIYENCQPIGELFFVE